MSRSRYPNSAIGAIGEGVWVAIYTLTVAVGLFGVIWEEVSE